MPRPRLSVVILNHDSGQLLLQCLDSLFADTMPFEFEVIVPDNASTDDSLELACARWGDRIRVLHNGDNLGFSWGNNRGLEHAVGEYVCLLNPDTVIHPGAFPRLVEFMDSQPRAGCCGPRVLNSDGTFQLSAMRAIPSPLDAVWRAVLLSKLFPRSRRFARYNMTYRDRGETQRVDASTGCCMLIRREALEQVGPFDEGYFIYCEDVDWFLRAQRAGWEVWYVADAVIEHHHAYSMKFRRRRAVEDFHRSMLRFHDKFFRDRYPAVVNALIRAGVWARMHLMIWYRTVRGWS